MASFVRIIPNKLWEELLAKGMLEKSYPAIKKTKVEELLETIPQTLHHSIERIVNALGDKLNWNKDRNLIYNSDVIADSDVSQLLTAFVTKSETFKALPGSEQFKKIVGNLQNTEDKSQWVSFDSLNPPKKNGPRPKVRQKKISQSKNPRRAVGGGRIHKKQPKVQRPKKGVKNTKRS